MKKFFCTIILLGIMIGLCKSCMHESNQNRANQTRERIIPLPDFTNTEVDETYNPNTDYAQEYVDRIHQEQLDAFVNEEFYRNCVQAKSNFEQFFQNGKVSEQVQNHGNSINDGDVRFLDSCIGYMYELVDCYVSSYKNGDTNTCIGVGLKMIEFYDVKINKNYFFDILVASKIPAPYSEGDIDFTLKNGIYDGEGNIVLDNGSKLHVIGGNDLLLCADCEGDSLRERAVALSEWYTKVPSILLSHYAPVEHLNGGSDGICYLWNQTSVEKCCRGEWADIKNEGRDMYGFNPETSHIRWVDEANTFIFEGQDGEAYGPLTLTQNERVDHLYEVQDAIVFGSGDVHRLDTYIQAMFLEQGSYQYHK